MELFKSLFWIALAVFVIFDLLFCSSCATGTPRPGFYDIPIPAWSPTGWEMTPADNPNH